MRKHQVIWFWQRIVSPHMAGLAVALSHMGFEVVYVAEELVSGDRAKQGWTSPELGSVQLRLAPTYEEIRQLAVEAPEDSIHLCQGIRGNGLVSVAQKVLASRGLEQWVLMETIDDSGWRGVLKRLEYTRLLYLRRKNIKGILAIGYRTPEWIHRRGVKMSHIFPFAYFLPPKDVSYVNKSKKRFRFVFVGQFIERKRLDVLIKALAGLNRTDCELAVIGSGPLEDELRSLAFKLIPGQIRWIGRLPLESVSQEMAKADCLVLPSRHDGWGAVVSESMMVGTPVICSDSCGAAGVVKASGRGGVFKNGNAVELNELLERALCQGEVTVQERCNFANWAQCLGEEAGAQYLIEILNHARQLSARPGTPWGEIEAHCY